MRLLLCFSTVVDIFFLSLFYSGLYCLQFSNFFLHFSWFFPRRRRSVHQKFSFFFLLPLCWPQCPIILNMWMSFRQRENVFEMIGDTRSCRMELILNLYQKIDKTNSNKRFSFFFFNLILKCFSFIISSKVTLNCFVSWWCREEEEEGATGPTECSGSRQRYNGASYRLLCF